MGMAEQNGMHNRPQIVPYTSPQPYPSPQMQPSYAYPPPHGQHADHYRHSSTASNSSYPNVSLPPLRAIDGQAHSQPQLMPSPVGHQSSHSMGSMQAYYAHSQQAMSHSTHSLPPYARYAPIPQGAPIPGGRGKKEIKRRTKTGCLTCRKRRIKCDELHPVCRNCQKSKRECLGYDPIFKQQSGPAPLQPAQSGTTSSVSPTPSSTASAAASYSPTQSYPSQQPQQSPSYPQFPKSATLPSPSLHRSPSRDGPASIDPVLSRSPDLDRQSSHSRSPTDPSSIKMEGARSKPARQVGISELFQIGPYSPYQIAPNHDPLGPGTLDEVRNYFNNDLAPGLDRLLETEWFTRSGLERLYADRSLCSEVAELLKYFSQLQGQPEAEYQCRATEARTLWRVLCLCKPGSGATNGVVSAVPTSSIDLELPDGRLEVLECLITNRLLNERNLRPVQWDQAWPKEKTEDLMFWSALAKFVARRSDDPIGGPEMDKFLIQCRNMLSGRENRDVFYSIMVTRHIGWRVPGFPDNIQPETGGESSSVNKVFIAHKFITDEAGYKGTNHPVQRICDIVIRSWAIGW